MNTEQVISNSLSVTANNQRISENELNSFFHRLNLNPSVRRFIPDEVSTSNQVCLERKVNGVAVLSLGSKEQKLIVFNRERILSLGIAIKDLMDNPPKGLVVTGPSPYMFCYGADVNEITNINDPYIGAGLSELGQKLFRSIEELPCITVAAIGGLCVGGGAELTLHCKHRVMASHSSSQIWLPEVLLGLLPGWGGTQKLREIVGLKKALELICRSVPVKSEEALKIRLADEIIAPEFLLMRAEEIALGDKLKNYGKGSNGFIDQIFSNTGLVGKLARRLVNYEVKALRQIDKFDPYQHFPAPRLAQKAIFQGLNHGKDAGYNIEANLFGELACTRTAKSLQSLFFAKEKQKQVGREVKIDFATSPVLILGAGVMGRAIATQFLKKGATVQLHDLSEAQAVSAINEIAKFCGSGKKRDEVLQRLYVTAGACSLYHAPKLVIEAVSETKETKLTVLKQLEEMLPSDTIIVSNTSSLPISELATSLQNPERLVGMHFFNPVHKIEIVEVISGKDSSQLAVDTACAYVHKIGKTPILVKDVPGFLVNRILGPYLNVAILLYLDGVSIESIDSCAEEAGMIMGPFKTLDLVGIDIAKHVGQTLLEAYKSRINIADAKRASEFLDQLIKEKSLGLKTGLGFYSYKKQKISGINPKLKVNELNQITRRDITLDLTAALINEARLCLFQGVAGDYGNEAIDKINLATALACGAFPAFGGVLRYATETI